MAKAIYWWSSSWTGSKGCKEPPGCSSKVIIKFSIIMFLFFQMSCNFLTYCFPIQMRWLLEYLHFLGLYVKHIVLHFCLYFIALVPLAQSGMSHCLCVWVPFHEPSRFWHSSQWHVGPIWIIDMWVRVWNPERLTNWNPNSEISCVKTGTSFSKLWVSYLFPYWMFCMIKQSQTCFCITSAWLLIFLLHEGAVC